MASVLKPADRARALAALKEAERFVQGATTHVGNDAATLVATVMAEGRRMQQASASLVLALLKDDYAPAELFRPWASKRRFTQWRDDPAVKLDVKVIHGRLSVKPSAFFKHWASLPDETKRK